MAGGDVCVAQVEHDWVVTIEGPDSLALRYGTLRDAVDAGRRVALSTSSQLRLNLDPFGDGASLAGKPRNDQRSIAA